MAQDSLNGSVIAKLTHMNNPLFFLLLLKPAPLQMLAASLSLVIALPLSGQAEGALVPSQVIQLSSASYSRLQGKTVPTMDGSYRNVSASASLLRTWTDWTTAHSSTESTRVETNKNVESSENLSGDANHGEENKLDGHWDPLGSPYIPVDSWMYPALLRLYGLGYIDSATLSLRPWTRRSVLHMLQLSQNQILRDDNNEAVAILDRVESALKEEQARDARGRRYSFYSADTLYAGTRIVSGTVLRDSWHLGQTFTNDYGRPFSSGFNSYDGFSTITELGPLSIHVRGEFQHAPSYQGYDFSLSSKLARVDTINYGNLTPGMPLNLYGGPNRPEDTIPEGLLPSQNNFRLLEANLSVHVLEHEISFGKSDAWLGPGFGGAMNWSNNAENMYSFRINRIEPLRIPYFSRIFGSLRYDFFVGSLKGHTFPRDPWAHSEILSLTPTQNLQISFQRTIIWGGAGHSPITLHTFLKGFFSTNATTTAEKYSREDPGARFSSVTMSYRLPFLRRRAMIYVDSTTHDDIFPISAPRRAGWRPGIYFSQLPYVPKLDLRVEATYTDYVTTRSTFGVGNYFESVQRQGYTNKGFLLGDWIGREAKGGQAWLTYHISGNESLTLQYLRKKNAKDFIQYGTTQEDVRIDAIKRLAHNVELAAWIQVERWKAPIWLPGQHGNTTGAFQITWYSPLHSKYSRK